MARRGEVQEMFVKIIIIVAVVLVALLIIGLIARKLGATAIPW